MTAPRWRTLDLARGLAVIAMILFHGTWDASHFGYVAASLPWTPAIRFFGHAIAFAFLFIAGVSLTLANPDVLDRPKAVRRLARVGAAALAVTLGTWLVFPGAYVFFGILHCIFAASLAGLAFLRAPWPLTLVAALLCFLAPDVLASETFNARSLIWLGLGTRETLTQDWRPFFPWAGALLLGVAFARAPLSLWARAAPQASGEGLGGAAGEGSQPPLSLREREAPKAQGEGLRADPLPMGEGILFLGRHSLGIYLLHQPLLFALFTALVFVAPPAPQPTGFLALCERRCMAKGENKNLCRALCACTAREATRATGLDDAMDASERRRRLQEIERQCAATAP